MLTKNVMVSGKVVMNTRDFHVFITVAKTKSRAKASKLFYSVSHIFLFRHDNFHVLLHQ